MHRHVVAAIDVRWFKTMCVYVLTCRALDVTVSTTKSCFDYLKGPSENGGKRAVFEARRTM